MKTILITRTKPGEDFNNPKLERLLESCKTDIQEKYVISNKSNHKIKNVSVKVIEHDDPTSPISINAVLEKIQTADKTEAFLICSKEVNLKTDDIKALQERLQSNDKLLVVGYRFEIPDEHLNEELHDYYENGLLIAYKVPWNTCALWSYGLFNKYVGKFDEITAKNSFEPVHVCIDSVVRHTDHRGMEDGLAIAKAVFEARKEGQKIEFGLVEEKKLKWEINTTEPEKVLEHRKKLARKDSVMRGFMKYRGYPEKDLLRGR